MKRGFHATDHKMSPMHPQRSVTEFVGRHNVQPLDSIDQMVRMENVLDSQRLT